MNTETTTNLLIYQIFGQPFSEISFYLYGFFLEACLPAQGMNVNISWLDFVKNFINYELKVTIVQQNLPLTQTQMR